MVICEQKILDKLKLKVKVESTLTAMYSATVELLTQMLSVPSPRQNSENSPRNRPRKSSENSPKSQPKNSHYQLLDDSFVFSLSALYQQLNFTNAPSYNQYRRMIFASSLNLDLLPHHLKVISHGIESSTNTPLYCLMPITALVAGNENE